MTSTRSLVLGLLVASPSFGLAGCTTPTVVTDTGSLVLDAANTADAAATPDSALTPDAASTPDAPGTDSASCNVCVNGVVAWGTDGGRACTRDSSEVASCHAYTHQRVAEACLPPDLSCTNELDACNPSSSGVSTEALLAALADADVVAALAAAPVLYGSDPRPVDGSVRWFSVGAAGAHVEVGTGPGIPTGVANLLTVLDALDAAQLARAGCIEVFPPAP